MSKHSLRMIFLMLWLPFSCFAANFEPLPANEVFHVGVNVLDTQKMLVVWQISPGYYLYRNRMQIQIKPSQSADIQYPQGELKYNKTWGRYEAYEKSAVIPVIFSNHPTQIQLTLNYQGCSQDGFCYPPMQKIFQVDFTTQLVSDLNSPSSSAVDISALMTDQNSVQLLFNQQSYFILLLLFMGLGLLLAFTPCVFPMIPILLSIIVGQHQPVTAKKAFFLSLSYALGSACMYAIAGLLVALIGSSIQVWLQQSWVLIIASVLFILLALSLFGFYELRLPAAWQTQLTQLTHRCGGKGYVGVGLMGMLSILIISPCVTAPLVGVLMFVAERGNAWLGASALFMLGIGMGLPLLLIGTSAGKCLPKAGPWMQAIRYIFGLAMLGVAILLLVRAVPLNRLTHRQTVFTTIHTIKEWNHQLANAKASHQPVIVDFYADWCQACLELEENVFSQAEVKRAITSYALIRVDLSEMSKDEAELLKRYHIVAPPTLLFFNANGVEQIQQRIVGEVSAQEFLRRLAKQGS